jgi:hypothetical protein
MWGNRIKSVLFIVIMHKICGSKSIPSGERETTFLVPVGAIKELSYHRLDSFEEKGKYYSQKLPFANTKAMPEQKAG